MSWNIKVIHRSIKLTENVPLALGKLNSAGFLIGESDSEKKKNKNKSKKYPTHYKSMDQIY